MSAAENQAAHDAANRMRTKWDRASKTVEEKGDLRMDYIEDLCILADAWMIEHGGLPVDPFKSDGGDGQRRLADGSNVGARMGYH